MTTPQIFATRVESIQMIKVLLVDDSENTRRGLRMMLRLETDIEIVG